MKNTHLSVVLTVLMLVMVGCSVNVNTSTFKETRELTLPAEGIEVLEVDVSSGSLIITGEEGREKIEAVANIEYTKNIKDEDIQFDLKQRGNSIELIGKFKSHFNVGYVSQSMDIVVKIPKKMNLDVKDGSGDMLISKIDGDLDIDDGSGNVTVTDVTGLLKILDGSGDIELTNVNNISSIEDGSGNLLIQDSKGNVSIDDNSGDIEIIKYGGDINLIDGSGQIEIMALDGSVTIIDDGSGDITIKDVSKDVVIKNDGSGDVEIDNVKGTVTQ